MVEKFTNLPAHLVRQCIQKFTFLNLPFFKADSIVIEKIASFLEGRNRAGVVQIRSQIFFRQEILSYE